MSPPRSAPPTDFARPPSPSYRRERASIAIGEPVARELEAIARGAGASRDVALLAGWMMLLARYAGAAEVEVAGVGRANEDAPVAVHAFLATELTVRDVLSRVERSLADARPLEDTSVGCGTLLLARSAQDTLPPALDALAAACDFAVYAERTGGGLMLTADYDAELYAPATAQRVLEHFARLLGEMAARPDARWSEPSLLSANEEAQVLRAWNDTACAVPEDVCVHDLIARQARETPERAALCAGAERLTYAELNVRANRLARRLLALGVAPDDRVAICLDRSPGMVIAVLGVLKAGAAYLPIDPATPAARAGHMMRDASVRAMVTRTGLSPAFAPADAPTVLLDQLDLGDERVPADDPATSVKASSLAYVIYTSGSTGAPKGVMVEHRNVVNFFAGMDRRIRGGPGVWLALTNLTFDISVLELLWTLARGFTVVLHDPADLASSAFRRTRGPGESAPRAPLQFGLFFFASDEDAPERVTGRAKYELLLEGAKFADRRGFTAVWTPERHFHPFGGMYPSPSVAGAALAVLTERVQIRAGSCVLPLHDPVRVTEEWSLVDNLSGGRVAVSFASGWQPEDFVFAPDQYESRHEAMFGAIDTVRRLWRGETIARAGGKGTEVAIRTRPRPVQPELPVWVTAGGTPSTFQRAGEIGANVLTHLLGQSVDELRQKITSYRDAWRAHGHGPGDGHVTLMLHTFVGDDERAVRDTAFAPLERYLRGSISLFTPFAASLGLNVKSLSAADMDTLAERACQRFYETSGLFGTPESCLPMVESLAALGVDEIACLIDFGVPTAEVLRHLDDLARLRDLATARARGAPPPVESTAALMRRHGVTHLQCTPSLARLLLADADTRQALGSVRQMLVGGEALPAALARELAACLPEGALANMYGPTETTVWSTAHDVSAAEDRVPIGRPIANTRLFVLDATMRPVPVGATGELYIGGRGVARGYLGRPELTRERFVELALDGGAPQRLYRTGDVVRWRADGVLEYIGRADHQVKIRGHRVELGEVETVLRQHATVRDAAVILREDAPGDQRLVAYVVTGEPSARGLAAVEAHARAMLPEVMVPTAWVELASLPLTPGGKVDRVTLPPPAAASAVSAHIAPRTETERLLERIWRESLKLPRVSVHDDFFALGGHSLLAVHVVNRVREHWARELSMADMFRFPTIEAFAAYLDAPVAPGARASTPILPDARRARQPSIAGEITVRPNES